MKLQNIHSRTLMHWLVIAYIALFVLFCFLIQLHQKNSTLHSYREALSNYKQQFEYQIEGETSLMLSFGKAISNSETTLNALRNLDRQQLLEQWQSLYQHLNTHLGITHFYFHCTDQTNILRLHNVDRFGDKIDRVTMQQAVKTKEPAYGFELGIFGTYTLRVVSPIFDQDEIVGYVELGKDIEDYASSLTQHTTNSWAIFLQKQLLDKSNWVEGMQFLNRDAIANWDLDADYVMSASSDEQQDIDWKMLLADSKNKALIELNDKTAYGVVSLIDVLSNPIGIMLIRINKSDAMIELKDQSYVFLALIAILMMFHLFIMRHVLKKTDRKIADDQVKLELLATHDSLTKLPNRLFFKTRLTHAVALAERHKQHLAVFFVDLDGFKNVNDTYGHNIGDQLLIAVAEKLRSIVRKTDTVARISGDEFVLLLEEINNQQECSQLANKIITLLNEPIVLSGHQIQVTASIGICLYPDGALDADQLMIHADNAMYEAKTSGKNRFVFYTK